jgi:hypothetical protein
VFMMWRISIGCRSTIDVFKENIFFFRQVTKKVATGKKTNFTIESAQYKKKIKKKKKKNRNSIGKEWGVDRIIVTFTK